MNSKVTASGFKPFVPGAFPGGLSRTAYFDGMVLSEADMLREQDYWRTKRQLTNRALGQGVVWGLSLVWDERSRCFTLCPGYGLSCCGDDLVVECPESVGEGDLIDLCSEDFQRLFAQGEEDCGCDQKPEGTAEACLLLEYVECPEDPRRVFEDPCAVDADGCRYGAIRETTRLRLVRPPLPPPQDAISQFCAKVSAFRNNLADAGVDLPEPIFGDTSPTVRLSLKQMDSSANVVDSSYVDISELESGMAHDLTSSRHAETTTVQVGLEPPTGKIFTKVSVDDIEVGAESLMGHFISNSLAGLSQSTSLKIESAPLLGGTQVERREYRLRTVGGVGADELTVRLELQSVETFNRQTDCNALLENWLVFENDPDCTVRTLVLAVLCGLFTGAVGAQDCESGSEETDSARSMLAWLACTAAWRLLFGVDTTVDGQSIHSCLRQLFLAWCEGMHYKGPRCDNYEHGVLLGCVRVSAKGRIECFDEWRHRRYVLTGPLLSHWAGQFGLAPLDVTATRLASWICCVANTTPPTSADFQQTSRLTAILPIANSSLAYDAEMAAATSFNEVPIVDRKTASPAEFVDAILKQLLSQSEHSTGSSKTLQVTSLPDSDLHLIQPSNVAAIRERSALRAEIVDISVDRSLTPAAMHQPLGEMMSLLAENVSLSMIKPEAESSLFEPAARALENVGLESIADISEVGPEIAADRVRAELLASSEFEDDNSVDKAVAMVFNSGVGVLQAAANVVTKQAANRQKDEPFTRGDLLESSTLSDLRSAANDKLRGKGMNKSLYREIAAQVVAARR